MKITIEDLRQYRARVIEMSSITIEINTTYTELPTTGKESNGGRSLTPGDPTVKKVHKIENLIKKRNELAEAVQRVDDWLIETPRSDIAAICRYHYVLGYSWQRTSWTVYGKGNGSTCRHIVERYFKYCPKVDR